MKISLAQIRSGRGAVNDNVHMHIDLIGTAIEAQSDLIVFPELSITNYEPQLAAELAVEAENELFFEFQELSDSSGITICIGMPLKSEGGIHISMIIFQKDVERQVYSKQLLHEDELPFFIPGNSETFLNLKGKKIAFGICYESLQMEHFLKAKSNGADIYIASVAKPQNGIERAYAHFPIIAKEYQTPILMTNSVGPCDNFINAGQSAAWNEEGEKVGQMGSHNRGLLTIDLNSKKVSYSEMTE